MRLKPASWVDHPRMTIDMNEARLSPIEQIREFLAGTADVAFTVPPEDIKRRRFIATVLKRFRDFRLSKGPRGVLFSYMQRLSGYSRQHLSRLLAQYRDTQSLQPLPRANRTSFACKYGPAAVVLLAELDTLHDTLSGPATKVLAQRAHTRFGDRRFAPLAAISVSHRYHLRASAGYQKQRVVWQRTRPSPSKIGVRKAPAPQGIPGYIRIAESKNGAVIRKVMGYSHIPQHHATAINRFYSEQGFQPLRTPARTCGDQLCSEPHAELSLSSNRAASTARATLSAPLASSGAKERRDAAADHGEQRDAVSPAAARTHAAVSHGPDSPRDLACAAMWRMR
jgi:hypothetical protein